MIAVILGVFAIDWGLRIVTKFYIWNSWLTFYFQQLLVSLGIEQSSIMQRMRQCLVVTKRVTIVFRSLEWDTMLGCWFTMLRSEVTFFLASLWFLFAGWVLDIFFCNSDRRKHAHSVIHMLHLTRGTESREQYKLINFSLPGSCRPH